MNELQLTERQKGLLTLLVDKINWGGCSMGANRNKNWLTTPKYDWIDSERMQGTLDRIGKVKYHRTFHVKEEDYDMFNPIRLGPDIFDHSIYCEWKELFGLGVEETKFPEGMLQDKAGRWHAPCDKGIHVHLWHPISQARQEKVFGCWDLRKPPHWRPIYHYTRDEVIEALQLMCETFGWEFEEDSDSEWSIIY